MRTRSKAAALALSISICLLHVPAQANFYSGNDFHEACIRNGYGALLYVMGIFDGVEIGHVSGGKKYYCVPEEVIAQQIMEVACKHVRENPQDRHYPASFPITKSLQEAWPCF